MTMDLNFDEVKRLYQSGKSIEKIAQALGTYDKKVMNVLKVLEDEGEIVKRERIPSSREKKAAERFEKLVQLWNEGKTYKEISAELNCTYETAVHWVRKAIDEGRCQKRIPQPKATHGINGGVICNDAIKKKCKYGHDGIGIPMCNYLFITGNMRECSGKDCTCYEERTTEKTTRKWRNNDDVFC